MKAGLQFNIARFGQGRLDTARISCTETFQHVLAIWQSDLAAAAAFGQTLAALPFDGAYWECPRFDSQAPPRDFECVLVHAPRLARKSPSSAAFAEHLAAAPQGAGVITFPTLGGGSQLVVPIQLAGREVYGHLMPFLRGAPGEQVGAFFSQLAAIALRDSQSHPIYLSTSGDGVPWLHGRIDRRPKYYTWLPYRR